MNEPEIYRAPRGLPAIRQDTAPTQKEPEQAGAPHLTYDGGRMGRDWAQELPDQIRRELERHSDPRSAMTEAPGQVQVVRHERAHFRRRIPWRVHPDKLVRAWVYQPLGPRTDGRLTPAGSWYVERVQRTPLLVEGGVRTHREILPAGTCAAEKAIPTEPFRDQDTYHSVLAYGQLPPTLQTEVDRLVPEGADRWQSGGTWMQRWADANHEQYVRLVRLGPAGDSQNTARSQLVAVDGYRPAGPDGQDRSRPWSLMTFTAPVAL